MMIDLPPHRRRLADHRVAKVRRLGGRRVHDDGQRRLERVGQIAGMGARFFRLPLIMGKEGVQFLHHRQYFGRHRFCHPAFLARPHPDDFQPHLAQRAQAVDRLQRRQHEQPERQQRETLEQGGSQCLDLRVQSRPRLRHHEQPVRVRSGQHHRALHDAQVLAGELLAVIDVQLAIIMFGRRLERPVPQGPRPPILTPLGADLVIEPAIGLQESLVGQFPVEQHLAVRADFGCGDHRGQHIIHAVVEIARDRVRQHAVQRHAAADQQHTDPQCGNADHAPADGAGRPDGGRGCRVGHYLPFGSSSFERSREAPVENKSARTCSRQARTERAGAAVIFTAPARPGCTPDPGWW